MPLRSVGFEVPGKPVSTNQITRHVGGRAITSEAAREMRPRIASLAKAEMLRKGYRKPFGPRVSLDIRLYNCRIDCSNAIKLPEDCLEGVVYENDKYVVAVSASKHRDDAGERLLITVIELPEDG